MTRDDGVDLAVELHTLAGMPVVVLEGRTAAGGVWLAGNGMTNDDVPAAARRDGLRVDDGTDNGGQRMADWYWVDGAPYCPACVEGPTPAIDVADATRGPCTTGRCACCGHTATEVEQPRPRWSIVRAGRVQYMGNVKNGQQRTVLPLFSTHEVATAFIRHYMADMPRVGAAGARKAPLRPSEVGSVQGDSWEGLCENAARDGVDVVWWVHEVTSETYTYREMALLDDGTTEADA